MWCLLGVKGLNLKASAASNIATSSSSVKKHGVNELYSKTIFDGITHDI